MRVFWCAVWIMALTATGQAAPMPPPPEDFGGSQYIDGKGCVFLRDGGGWVARLDKSGAAICGFPPTLSSRRTDPEMDRVLPSAETEAQPSAEDLLVETLAAGLRQGEFLSDPAPAEERRAPLPSSQTDPMQAELSQLAAHEATLRGALSGAGPSSSDLCAMLGYRAEDDPAPILGGDVTQGLCAGMRAAVPERRITEGVTAPERPVTKTASTDGRASAPAASSLAQDRRKAAADAPKAAATGKGALVAGSVKDRRPLPKADREATVEMIPASARYVQIGGYADDANAVSAIRRLSAMGFRVAQKRSRDGDRTLRVILAGPFTDRRDLIEALNRLRANGYPKAVAR